MEVEKPTNKHKLIARLELPFGRDRSGTTVVRIRNLKMPLQSQTLTQKGESTARNTPISFCFQARPH